MRADDRHVRQRLDAIVFEEVGVGETRLLVDVGGRDGLAGSEGIPLRRSPAGFHVRLSDDAGLPADAGLDEQSNTILLQLHDLGEVGAEGLADQDARLVQYLA